MNQEKKKDPSGQVEYLGRWVDKQDFRVFVYNEKEQRLATSYDEFSKLIASGLWFPTKEVANKIFSASTEVKTIEKKPIKIENKSEKSKVSAKNQFKNAVNNNLKIGLI